MINFLLAAAIAGCTFVGPAEFDEGGEVWCDVGAFEKVEIQINDERTKVEVDLAFNADGFKTYSGDSENVALFFAGIIETFAKVGVYTDMRFHFGGEILAHCWPDFDEGSTVCQEGS